LFIRGQLELNSRYLKNPVQAFDGIAEMYRVGHKLCRQSNELRITYSGVIPNMSGITLHLGLSIFWIRANFRHKLLCSGSGYAGIQKIERPRCRVIRDMLWNNPTVRLNYCEVNIGKRHPL